MARNLTTHSQSMVAKSLLACIGRIVGDDPIEKSWYATGAWKLVREVAQRTSNRGWQAFLVGGALRDLFLTGLTNEPRDLDFVISWAAFEEISFEFRDFGRSKRTSLGGLRLTTRDVPIDIWPLNETHSMRGKKRITIEDVPRHAFLNLEAIAAEVSQPRNGERQLFESGFTHAVTHRTLEVNYKSNPLPEVCIVKTFRTAIRWRMTLGQSLIKFVKSRSWQTDRLLEAQRRHFGDSLLDRSLIEQSMRAVAQCNSRTSGLDLASALASHTAELSRRTHQIH